MSVYLGEIIPIKTVPFKDTLSRDKFLISTAEKLADKMGWCRKEEIEYERYSGLPNFSLGESLEFTLYEDFWLVDPYLDDWMLGHHPNGSFYARNFIFEIVRILDAKEAWHTRDFLSFDGYLCGNDMSLKEWLKIMEEHIGGAIPEFSEEEILSQSYKDCPDLADIYHDSFDDCFEKIRELENKLSPLGYTDFNLPNYNNLIKCKLNGHIIYLDSDLKEVPNPLKSHLNPNN